MHATFVSFDAYPLLDPTLSAGIGGAEVRAVTFARGLQENHDVDIDIVVKHRNGLKTSADGMGICSYSKPRVGPLTKLGRSLTKRMGTKPAPNPFFAKLNTDVVLCFGVRNDTASIVRSVKESGKRCVVFLTSDRNIEDARREGRQDRGIYGELGHLCRYSLQNADQVVTQTLFQQESLSEHLGIDAQLIRNPIDLTNHASPSPNSVPTILWVGRADTFSKRADLCIELAKRCSQLRFEMVMNNHDDAVFTELVSTLPSNVEIIEHVAFRDIEAHFSGSSILVNTSAAEGFPNSFLQAAKYGKPIVSLDVDPGRMLSEFGCGICSSGDLDSMATTIQSLVNNQQRYDVMSKQARAYVLEYHDANARCAELHDVLCNVTREFRTVA